MKKMVFARIDVSAGELPVAVQRDGVSLPVPVLENDAAGHGKLIRWLGKSGRPVRVCLAATGVYGLELAPAHTRARRFQVLHDDQDFEGSKFFAMEA